MAITGVTPPLVCMVPIRFEVGPSPVLITGKEALSVSPGSGALFAGDTLSKVIVAAPPEAMIGVPAIPQQTYG